MVYKKAILLTLYDIAKLFDLKVLADGMETIYDSGVKGKLYSLLYMLNKETIIKVNTGVRMTTEKKLARILAREQYF